MSIISWSIVGQVVANSCIIDQHSMARGLIKDLVQGILAVWRKVFLIFRNFSFALIFPLHPSIVLLPLPSRCTNGYWQKLWAWITLSIDQNPIQGRVEIRVTLYSENQRWALTCLLHCRPCHLVQTQTSLLYFWNVQMAKSGISQFLYFPVYGTRLYQGP